MCQAFTGVLPALVSSMLWYGAGLGGADSVARDLQPATLPNPIS